MGDELPTGDDVFGVEPGLAPGSEVQQHLHDSIHTYAISFHGAPSWCETGLVVPFEFRPNIDVDALCRRCTNCVLRPSCSISGRRAVVLCRIFPIHNYVLHPLFTNFSFFFFFRSLN
jgi:hypothetical protein